MGVTPATGWQGEYQGTPNPVLMSPILHVSGPVQIRACYSLCSEGELCPKGAPFSELIYSGCIAGNK